MGNTFFLLPAKEVKEYMVSFKNSCLFLYEMRGTQLSIKSLMNWKSYSQSQSKWPYNHDLKSLACTHDLKRIGIAKSVKISTLLSNHFPNQFLYARLRELHNWNFRIFKKRWQICFFSQVRKWSERIWKWFDGNQIKSLIVSGKSQSILLTNL